MTNIIFVNFIYNRLIEKPPQGDSLKDLQIALDERDVKVVNCFHESQRVKFCTTSEGIIFPRETENIILSHLDTILKKMDDFI